MILETVTISAIVLGPAFVIGIGALVLTRMVPDTMWSQRAKAYAIIAPILIAIATTIYVLNYFGII